MRDTASALKTLSPPVVPQSPTLASSHHLLRVGHLLPSGTVTPSRLGLQHLSNCREFRASKASEGGGIPPGPLCPGGRCWSGPTTLRALPQQASCRSGGDAWEMSWNTAVSAWHFPS